MANLIMLMCMLQWAAYRLFDLHTGSPERAGSRSCGRKNGGGKKQAIRKCRCQCSCTVFFTRCYKHQQCDEALISLFCFEHVLLLRVEKCPTLLKRCTRYYHFFPNQSGWGVGRMAPTIVTSYMYKCWTRTTTEEKLVLLVSDYQQSTSTLPCANIFTFSICYLRYLVLAAHKSTSTAADIPYHNNPSLPAGKNDT